CKCPIDLLEQNHASEFVGQGHLAEGENQVSRGTSLITETIGRADTEEEILGATILLVAQQFRKLLRGELTSAGVQQYEDRRCATGCAVGQLEQRGFVG